MADAIIKYRDEHRGFKSIDEVRNVPGISETRADKVRDQAEI